ncbi:MAG: FAD-binding protein [Eggerthellaceae bacterium]
MTAARRAATAKKRPTVAAYWRQATRRRHGFRAVLPDRSEQPSEIKEEKDCDVVVVGYGLAGSAAAKAAAEEGAKVIVVEKAGGRELLRSSMAGDFGVVGSIRKT